MNPESQVGCHAGDLESYRVFSKLFNPIIEDYHKGYKTDGSMKHITDMDSSKIGVKLEENAKKKNCLYKNQMRTKSQLFPS